MDDRTLTIEYDLTARDVAAFARHHAWHEPSMRRLWLITGACVVVGAGLFFYLDEVRSGRGDSLEASIAAVGTAGAAAILWVLMLLFIPRQMASQMRKTPGLVGPHTVQISPERLVSRTPLGEARREWESVERIVGTREHILIYWNRAQALVIPRRSFASPAEADAFLQSASLFRSAARPRGETPSVAAELPEAAPPEGALAVSYELIERDLDAFQRYHLLHNNRMRVALLLMAVVGGLGGASLGGVWGGAGGVLVMAAVFFLLVPWIHRRQARRIRGILGRHSLFISPEGVAGRSPGIGEGRLEWAAVPRLCVTGDYLYLYVGENNAVVVPRRSFPTTAEAEAFIRQAREWHAARAGGRGQTGSGGAR